MKLYLETNTSKYEIYDDMNARACIFKHGYTIVGDDIVGKGNAKALIRELMTCFVPVNKV